MILPTNHGLKGDSRSKTPLEPVFNIRWNYNEDILYFYC